MLSHQTERRIRGKEGEIILMLQEVWAPNLQLQEEGRRKEEDYCSPK